MSSLSRSTAALAFAARRMRARPVAVAGTVIAFAAAGLLIGWSGLRAGLALEADVPRQIERAPDDRRSLMVLYHVPALGFDARARDVRDALARVADVTAPPRRLQVWHPVRVTASGLRIATTLGGNAVVSAGRLPAGCRGNVCEALVVRGRSALGERVALGEGVSAQVVGRGRLPLPDTSRLETPLVVGGQLLLVRRVEGPLTDLLATRGTSILTTAPLHPAAVHASELRAIERRLRSESVQLRRGGRLTAATAPSALLEELADRGDAARRRLLIVAGQGAALILAFAAFAAAVRRRDARRLEEQLVDLGGSRAQLLAMRTFEALVPCVAGGLLAVGLLRAMVARAAEGLPVSFTSFALPAETLAAIAGATLAGAALMVVMATARPRRRFGTLEVAAVAALAAIVWQTAAAGALDAAQVQTRDPGPVLLLLPALLLFTSGVVLLRVLPLVLRACERLARRGPFGLRLGLLSAARSPAEAAAATTFLAVALGSAFFCLNYQATLDAHAGDEAAFAAGAPWRAAAGSGVPALRSDVRVLDGPRIELLGLPPEGVIRATGWRDAFSALPRADIAARLRPRPVRLGGPPIERDAQALRIWARAETELPRVLVLHFLRPAEQRFVAVRAGVLHRRWQRLHIPLPADARGAELVGVEFAATVIPVTGDPDLNGYVELGPFSQQGPAGSVVMPLLDFWVPAAPPPNSTDRGNLVTWSPAGAPLGERLRFDLRAAPRPLIRPPVPLPEAVPVLASESVARRAVDGVVTVAVAGVELPLRVVGRAELFPTLVARPHDFAVADYDTLFALLNVDRPGAVAPNERWSFGEGPPPAGAVSARALEAEALRDPLAAGSRDVLRLAALGAVVLALMGLIIATRATLAAERQTLAEYEALGVGPRTLARSIGVRLLSLWAIGVAAALVGAVAAVRIVAAFVAVTGTTNAPLPPIEPVVAWRETLIVLAATLIAAAGAAAVLAAGARRDAAAQRLRA